MTVVQMNTFTALLVNTSSHRWSYGCVQDTPADDHELCNRISPSDQTGTQLNEGSPTAESVQIGQKNCHSVPCCCWDWYMPFWYRGQYYCTVQQSWKWNVDRELKKKRNELFTDQLQKYLCVYHIYIYIYTVTVFKHLNFKWLAKIFL
jgi:hypothetical protein